MRGKGRGFTSNRQGQAPALRQDEDSVAVAGAASGAPTGMHVSNADDWGRSSLQTAFNALLPLLTTNDYTGNPLPYVRTKTV